MAHNKRILVTGGAGYIGSHTVVELMGAGYEVVIVDNFCNSQPWILERIRSITGIMPEHSLVDLSDRAATLDFFKLSKAFDGVIHFAALKAVGESMEKPLLYYQNNVFSLVNVLEGMALQGCHKMVFSSSCTVYGQPAVLPVTELSPIQPAWSAYGNTKQICESILQSTSGTTSLKSIALRYFNPIGAHPSALIGELPVGVPNNLVPYITQTAIGIRDYLRVFGNDYPTPDGTAIRDYLHVCDLARAHRLALEYASGMEGGPSFEAFNLGTGQGFSVLQIIQSFERVSHRKLPFQVLSRREGDIEQIWADVSKARDVLGWQTKLTLDDMMLSAWQWQQALAENNPNSLS